MAWQDVLPLSVTRIDAEQERELRLAAQARAGAEWALAALVARYQPPVTRYLTRLTGDADLARMLAERIFLRMERRLRGPHGGHQLRLWLLRACTEAGLDAVRRPHRVSPAQLEGPRFAGLLTGHGGDGTAHRLRAGWETLAEVTGTTRRQVRKLIWNSVPARAQVNAGTQAQSPEQIREDVPRAGQDPREALRYRLIRAVLAELPYGDAQCLALHLIASLNQAEVARALGITQSATRRRIVHGLQLFAQRYEAAAASLGLPLESEASQGTNVLEEAHSGTDVVATLAEAQAPIPAPVPFGQPEPLLVTVSAAPIWNGAYAGPGKDVGLGGPPAELFMEAAATGQPPAKPTEAPTAQVTPVMAPLASVVVDVMSEGVSVEPETIVDAAPFILMPAVVERAVVVAPEMPVEELELALGVECVPLVTDAAVLPGPNAYAPVVRLVPILTPGDAAVDGRDEAVEGVRIVPVLTPSGPEMESDTTLAAIIADGGLGAFGAPNGPTVPLPGREARRAAFTLMPADEERPTAG